MTDRDDPNPRAEQGDVRLQNAIFEERRKRQIEFDRSWRWQPNNRVSVEEIQAFIAKMWQSEDE